MDYLITRFWRNKCNVIFYNRVFLFQGHMLIQLFYLGILEDLDLQADQYECQSYLESPS